MVSYSVLWYGVQLRQLLFLVDRDLLLDEAGMIVFDQFRHALSLEKGKHISKFVVHGAS